jgi:hypothetical protein
VTYTSPRHCIFCGDPESLCQCPPEILAFASAHVVATDDGRGVVEGKTLRVLIERAQAYGREVMSKRTPMPAKLRRHDDSPKGES